jgi:hypothetical protein
MSSRLLPLALAAAACAGGGAPLPARPAARRAAAPPTRPRVPPACARTGQRPGPRDASRLEIQSFDDPWQGTEAHPIRLLSTAPLLYQNVTPGARLYGPGFSTLSQAAVSPQAAAVLTGLPFGEVVVGTFPGWTFCEPGLCPPFGLLAVAPLGAAAADAPLLAEWREGGQTEVALYGDDHALVSGAHGYLDLVLTPGQRDALLDSFRLADFDALPEDNHDLIGEYAVLACERYQQVSIPAHRHALAPVLDAFAGLGERARSLAVPVMMVKRSEQPAHVVDWPADAPALVNFVRLRNEALAQAQNGNHSSPMYRPIAPALRAVIPQPSREPIGVNTPMRYPAIVRDGDVYWEVTEGNCEPNSTICLQGTYYALDVRRPGWKPAPEWAPDLAKIDERGLVLTGKDERWRTLQGQYLQGNALYSVAQGQRIPEGRKPRSSLPLTGHRSSYLIGSP